MTMTVLTILQFIEILAAYMLMTIVFPAMIFHKKLENFRLCTRFMMYVLIGNFYMCNIIFILELLHIAFRPVVILLTIFLFLYLYIHCNRIDYRQNLIVCGYEIQKLAAGLMGRKTFFRNICRWIQKRVKKAGQWLHHYVFNHAVEWVILFLVSVLVFWIFGTNYIKYLGYVLSDSPVHNYWINGLIQNKLFVDGVYPYGFHTVICFMHMLFGFDVYVLLRLFGMVQLLYVTAMLYVFMRAIFKSRFTPFAGLLVYLGINIWNENAFLRFEGAVPQEFGMIFILPTVYFLYAFLAEHPAEKKEKKPRLKRAEKKKYKQEEKEKNKEKKKAVLLEKAAEKKLKKNLSIREKVVRFLKKRKSSLKQADKQLLFFGMSFSLTLAVHFYITIIAALFCLAVAFGFIGRTVKKQIFVPVMRTTLLAVLIAVLPMGIAYATGTPMQGSLKWAVGVMSEKDKSTQTDNVNVVVKTTTDTTGTDTNSSANTSQSAADTAGNATSSEVQNTTNEPTAKTMLLGLQMQIVSKVLTVGYRSMVLAQNIWFYSITKLNHYILAPEASLPFLPAKKDFAYLVFGFAGLTFLMAGLLWFKNREYANRLFSIVFFTIFLLILLVAKKVGLPQLMDENRSRIFVVYQLALLAGSAVDAVLYVLSGNGKKKWLMEILSLSILLLGTGYVYQQKLYRKPFKSVALETNGAITSLTNIIHQEKKDTWTIISANDETQMVDTYGYHYETITFLRNMEGYLGGADIRIPTEKVFVFVEKVPLDYTKKYAGSGQKVSKKGAKMSLPGGGGLDVYEGQNRFIVMSRMYYWAKQFQKLYPNEMIVYYEDKDFICYCLDQNTYSLYNMAIDYGYNVTAAQDTTKEGTQ